MKHRDKFLQKSIEFLKTQFVDVEAIILHGSRTTEYARPYSDWDFFVFSKTDQKQEFFRHEIDEHNIEYTFHLLPIQQKDIFHVFDTKLQFAEVIYDVRGLGRELLDSAKALYQKGIPEKWFSKELKEHRRNNREHIIKGLQDTVDEPAMFLKKLGQLYPQIINEWYWFKKRDFPKNLYISIPQIEKEDPFFFEKLRVLFEFSFSSEQKIQAAKEIVEYIYE